MSHQFQLSSDDITRLCQELVYTVAYSFYDAPYIIILKMLVLDNVTTESALANKVGLTAGEVRKYLGTLYLHRLVRRHVNKEKSQMPEWKMKQLAQQGKSQQNTSANTNGNGSGQKGATGGAGAAGGMENRTRDVIYWYLDYREFANVVKYRLAMMRKGIDDKIKQEVGHRGYICPMDGTTYDPLDLSHLYDPFSNAFKCELCQSELIEHDPSLDASSSTGTGTGTDAMQKFNIATSPIRDALKAVEGLTIPSINIVAWIAVNVKTTVVQNGENGGLDDNGNKNKFEIVIGDDQDDDKDKLAQAQREQNALPVWHTHSTVTGSATTLGIEDQRRREAHEGKSSKGSKETNGTEADHDLAKHYESLGGDDDDDDDDDVREVRPAVAIEKKDVVFSLDLQDDDEEEDDDQDGMEDVAPVTVSAIATGASEGGGQTVYVNGELKRLEDVTEDDHDLMTTEEYEAYAQAMYG